MKHISEVAFGEQLSLDGEQAAIWYVDEVVDGHGRFQIPVGWATTRRERNFFDGCEYVLREEREKGSDLRSDLPF